MGGIQNIIKFSDCRDFYVFLLLKLRVEVISFALVDCDAESGNRGVHVNELEILY
jgi:hypothetical protein